MSAPPGGLTFSGEIFVKLRAAGGFTPRAAIAADEVARATGLEYVAPFASSAGLLGIGPGVTYLDDLTRWHVLQVPISPAPSFTGRGVAPEEAWNAVREVLRRPEVEWAEPDAILDIPLDPAAFFARATPPVDWHLDLIAAPAAWDLAAAKGRKPGEGVIVGHLDTGWTEHEAVPRGRFVSAGLDLTGGGPDARDPMESSLTGSPGHGTGTMCLLAADHADYRGVARGCRVFPVRISPSVVHVQTRTMAEGIIAAAEAGAEVITISMGGLPSQLWADAVNRAYEMGVVICAAAGNNVPLPFGLRTPARVVYPARFDRVLAVSGVTQEEKRYWFRDRMSGNDGPEVDICAPTPDVRWAIAPAGYGPGGGTSTATPQVAGAAAVWLSHHREALAGFTPVEKVEACRRALLVGSQHVPGVEYEPSGEGYGRLHHDWFGTGRLDVAAALAQPPVRGLRPQERASVSWALLKLLGIASGSAADPDDLADRIELLWRIETTGIGEIAREVVARRPGTAAPS